MKLQAISQLAAKKGAKILVYGPPGTGKTPMCMALPDACACITESGLASARTSNMPGALCQTYDDIVKFFNWVTDPRSNFTNQYKNLVVDSLSHLAKIVLRHEESRCKDGRQAYGKMSKYVINIVEQLQVMPNLNVVFTAQMATTEELIPGTLPIPGQMQTKRYNQPLFPGQVLSKEIPHTIDVVLYAHRGQYPQEWGGGYGPLLATTDKGDAMARDRTMTLAAIEPPDLNLILSKINQ